MKDKEVMDFIQSLGRSIKALEERVSLRIEWLESEKNHALTGVVVRDCPVCKHETLQKIGIKKPPPKPWCTLIYWEEDDFDYLCLTCGSKLVCETKTECKVLKEEKKK